MANTLKRTITLSGCPILNKPVKYLVNGRNYKKMFYTKVVVSRGKKTDIRFDIGGAVKVRRRSASIF